ncbi:HEAT repeat domain-containing protein [Catenulispora pinisilvae]|uniref:HEAT repeat domain-containing protein n=1 Tax=Catenulispora pinisilvae TaxID=2705253 RepID=UPI0018922391|nr:HEAT repeat domain-containing protein [Catenulispora pinisilvae]
MLTRLAEIDWSSMSHAYGTAEEVPDLLVAMASDDEEVRDKAFSRFYSVVHHQGDVYARTIAAVPFLVELAEAERSAARAQLVRVLASISEACLDHSGVYYTVGGELFDFGDAAATMAGHALLFERFATHPDPQVRLAAIPAVAHFPTKPARTAALLQDWLGAEVGVLQRLAVVNAPVALALRRPDTAEMVMAWLEGLAANTGVDVTIRLAALSGRARCTPDDVPAGLVASAVDLIRAVGQSPAPTEQWANQPKPKKQPAPAAGVPPFVTAAFEQIEHSNTVFAPTTGLLRELHQALGDRITDRALLLSEQLRSPDAGTRLDGIRMAGDMMTKWRGDHSALILLIADRLRGPAQVAAEAATVLGTCHRLAEPAREALAERVAHKDCDEHDGPQLWAADEPRLRRAHQEAVLTLARLGDARALPSLLVALDEDVDAWRAIPAATHLPQCARQFAPRLRTRLAALDVAKAPKHHDKGARALLSALTTFGDPDTLPLALTLLDAAMKHEHWGIATEAAKALGTFGTPTTPAVPMLRQLVSCPDWTARTAALVALWQIGGNEQEALEMVGAHLVGPAVFHDDGVGTVLGELGPAAADLTPHLRKLLADNYEWKRVHAAESLWLIAGEPEAQTVIEVLLQTWTQNQMTGSFVVTVLDRMGPAAAPALPQLRAEIRKRRRGGRFDTIDTDEDLVAMCQKLIDLLE